MRLLWLAFVFLLVAAAQPTPHYTPETFWRDMVKGRLLADRSDIFDQLYKGAFLPGHFSNGWGMRGIVLYAHPEASPTKLVLAMSDATTPEATLTFIPRQSLGKRVRLGARVEFEGAPKSFTREPFMVTFEVTRDRVKVLRK